MSLQVWLPLNGDLHNQGLDDIVITNNGTTINNNGKIGKAVEFGQNKYIRLENYAATFLTYNTWSLSVWFKCTAQNTSHSGSSLISGGNWNSSNNLLILALSDFSSDKYRTLLISGSGTWNRGYSYDFLLNQWYHVVLTSGNGKMRAYVNGELIGDSYAAFKPATLEQTWICIGNGTYSQVFHFYGLMNDVRIYDHCLSPKEVEELSKGLVLHYKLSGENQILLPSGYQQLEYIESNGTQYINTGIVPTALTKVVSVVEMTSTTYYEAIFGSDGTTFCIQRYQTQNSLKPEFWGTTDVNNRTNITNNTKITAILDAKNNLFQINNTIKQIAKSSTPPSNPLLLFAKYTANKTTIECQSNSKHYLDMIYNNDILTNYFIPAKRLSDDVVGMYDIISKTFFVSAGTEAFIAGSTVSTSGTIYDSSGYGNNGITVNSIASIADSPRYDYSVQFNGSNTAIKVVNNNWLSQGMKALTINVWAKASSWVPKLFSCTETGGFNTEAGNSGYWRFPIHVYTNAAQTSYAYKYDSKEIQTSALSTTDWNMLTFVYDATTGTKTYINGELHHTYSNVSYGIHFNTNARLFLGCEANTANPTTPYFNGKQSDFRIYVTALTAEQIKELYNTSMTIDASGNVYAREVIEL